MEAMYQMPGELSVYAGSEKTYKPKDFENKHRYHKELVV